MHILTDPQLLRAALLEHPNEAVCLELVESGRRLIYRPGARVPILMHGSSSIHPSAVLASTAAVVPRERVEKTRHRQR
jgi:hypothetical protein